MGRYLNLLLPVPFIHLMTPLLLEPWWVYIHATLAEFEQWPEPEKRFHCTATRLATVASTNGFTKWWKSYSSPMVNQVAASSYIQSKKKDVSIDSGKLFLVGTTFVSSKNPL